MGKLIDRSREIFGLGPVKTALDELRNQVGALGKQLEEARRAREDLAHSPVSKSELVKATGEWIDALGAEYADRLRARLAEGYAARPLDIDKIAGGNHPLGPFPALGLGRRGADAEKVDPGALALFLPVLLKEGFSAQIEGYSLPNDAPHLVERRKQIAELDQQIENLEDQLDQIQTAARNAGVIIRSRATP